jgi:thymidylate synthase
VTKSNEQQYLLQLSNIIYQGTKSPDRTGVGTTRLFATRMEFDLAQSFPLLTTKRVFWKGVVGELRWMLSGSTNINDLPERMKHWWSPWANDDGSLGPTYGEQFRGGVDAFKGLLEGLKTNPTSRRHVISLWNNQEIENMNLPPCHSTALQFYVEDGVLSCQMYQRSADFFIGVPVNIAFYSLLTHLIAADCGYKVGKYIHVTGDSHIYNNCIDQTMEQLSRHIMEPPQLEIELKEDLLDFINKDLTDEQINDRIKLIGYKPQKSIKADIAV